ncbi:hypothetical protein RCH06_003297 [Polaromonas sp. CG_9.5]|uniref:hypothetical protein n=1 Tax=Polaromonas sp. CG_9.5 TaxID=3071705 RepID=UPI002E017BF0|nr:hypothetical protein [Polaromonas sp. CG_9.5]
MSLLALGTEDELSEAMGKRLLKEAGYALEPSPVLRGDGFGYLRSKMDSWCQMAARKPVLLLTDLDMKACPMAVRNDWMGARKPPENLVLRIVVREIESWVLADHDALRTLIGNRGTLPPDPDALADPKEYLLRLIAKQAPRHIREDLVAEKGAIASQGIGYNAHFGEWVRTQWSPARAADRSQSLRRARIRIGELVRRLQQHQDE